MGMDHQRSPERSIGQKETIKTKHSSMPLDHIMKRRIFAFYCFRRDGRKSGFWLMSSCRDVSIRGTAGAK
jgi:hypothetical protein